MRAPYREEIAKVAKQHGVEPELIESVIWQESSAIPHAFRHEPAYWQRYCMQNPVYRDHEPERIASSYGLMQIMYPTAVEMGFIGEPEELFKISTNLDLATAYLAKLLRRYNGQKTLALAAYNGGPGGVNKPVPLAYAHSVLKRYDKLKAAGVTY